MNLEEFEILLEENGFEYYTSGKSIALKECPTCGGNNFKVLLRVEDVDESQPFFGRCQKGSCRQGYSSISWLVKMGMPFQEAQIAHGLNPAENFKKNVIEEHEFSNISKPEFRTQEKKEQVIYHDTSRLLSVEDWVNHPVSQYAMKRGYVGTFGDIIKVDKSEGAVVFLVLDKDGNCVGYQKRFLYPSNPDIKTKSSKGFKSNEHLLWFENQEDDDIVICEGPFTALSAWHYGYTGVCTFSAHLGKKQLEDIMVVAMARGVNIGVAFDRDKAGLTGLNKIKNFMHWNDIKTFEIQPKSGNDLNDSWQNESGIIITKLAAAEPAIPSAVMIESGGFTFE